MLRVLGGDRSLRSLAPRSYRLIDALLQPHPHLNGFYDSIEEALRDAIIWPECLGPEAAKAPIGLEVSTRSGQWKTLCCPTCCSLPCRQPEASAPLIGSTSRPERPTQRSARNRLMFALVLLVLLAPSGFRRNAMACRILGSPVSHSCG